MSCRARLYFSYPLTVRQPASDSQRYQELDSLRGVAALIVVASHYCGAYPALTVNPTGLWRLIGLTPLHGLWAGSDAVSLFFVLSGFVLAIPFLKKRPQPYFRFAAKRIVRIYMPYIVVVALAYLARALLYHGPLPGLTGWFNNIWKPEVTALPTVLGHILLIPSFENYRLVPVFWSLVLEMRASLVFPLLMLLVVGRKWQFSAVIALITYMVATQMVFRLAARFPNQDYITTLLVLPMFVYGAILAQHRDTIIPWAKKIGSGWRLAAFIFAAFLHTIRFWGTFLPARIHGFDPQNVAFAAGIFIVLALSSNRASMLLNSRPLLAIGRASYSLYLVHAVVLISCLHAFYLSLGYLPTCLIALALTGPVTWLCYTYVEKPAIVLAHRVGKSPQSGLTSSPPATEV